MRYNVKEAKSIEYQRGQYFENPLSGDVYQIIEDRDRGFALMQVEEGDVTSDFNETMGSFERYTNIDNLVLLEKMEDVEFEQVKATESLFYQTGQYFENPTTGDVYRIIEDRDRGFALMDVEDAVLVSDFQETLDMLKSYTTLEQLVLLEQVGEVEFKLISK